MDKPAQWALVGAAWFMALTVAVIGFLAWRHFAPAGALGSASAPLQGSVGELAPGATAICPVTGQKLLVTATTPHVIYQDRVYYFSDQPDAAGVLPKRRFLTDPEAILHPGAAPTLEQQGLAAAAALSASAQAAVPVTAPTTIRTLVPATSAPARP